eukprot:791962-Prymnesium_polylepis.1
MTAWRWWRRRWTTRWRRWGSPGLAAARRTAEDHAAAVACDARSHLGCWAEGGRCVLFAKEGVETSTRRPASRGSFVRRP